MRGTTNMTTIISLCVLFFFILNLHHKVDAFQSRSLRHPKQFARTSRLHVMQAAPGRSDRIQRIKDTSFQKEVLRDVTAAEFAMVVGGNNNQMGTSIDYDKLIENLRVQREILNARMSIESGEGSMVKHDVASIKTLFDRVSETKSGLERFVQSQEYKTLRDKDIATEEAASNTTTADTAATSTTSAAVDSSAASSSLSNGVISSTGTTVSATATIGGGAAAAAQEQEQKQEAQKEEIIKELEDVKQSLSVILREDGTVDWDEASSTARQVGRLGTELWERLNGKETEEGIPSLNELLGQTTVKEVETDSIKAKKTVVQQGNAQLDTLLVERDELLQRLRKDVGQTEGVPPGDLQLLRQLDVRAKDMSKRIKLFEMDLSMERICEYLQQELENSLEPSDQKLFVAEAALLDKQISSLFTLLPVSVAVGETSAALVDDDELTLVYNEVTDLKYRLGLESSSSLSQFDWGSIGVLLSETGSKVKLGLAFYGDGTRMLVSDVQYAWRLLVKATTGTTLKAREVNVVRRTLKDLLTLIPFTVILLIPLSPVGHVLVFSFIQRFFPEFYPSCYTEKRLNLSKLYREIERPKYGFYDRNGEDGATGNGNGNGGNGDGIFADFSKVLPQAFKDRWRSLSTGIDNDSKDARG
jgi:hypothetical protein